MNSFFSFTPGPLPFQKTLYQNFKKALRQWSSFLLFQLDIDFQADRAEALGSPGFADDAKQPVGVEKTASGKQRYSPFFEHFGQQRRRRTDDADLPRAGHHREHTLERVVEKRRCGKKSDWVTRRRQCRCFSQGSV